MLTMQKQFVVSLADLRFVSIECPMCRTLVTMDMKEPHEFTAKYDAFTPKDCPACRHQYDSAVRPGVDALQRAYAALISIADRVSFRMDAESAETSVSGRASDSKA
jgi:primosomal protein N'